MIRHGFDDGPNVFTAPSKQLAAYNKAGLPQG